MSVVYQQIEALRMVIERLNDKEEYTTFICLLLKDVGCDEPSLEYACRSIRQYIEDQLGKGNLTYYAWLVSQQYEQKHSEALYLLGMRALRIIWVERMIHYLETKGELP